MYGFSVVLSAETASFRDPGAQLYHETLPLPPVSTIIGIAGAALGMSFKDVWQHFQVNEISVGVKDVTREYRKTPPGKGLDLWKYRKIVSKEVRSDILKREFIFRPVYCLFYGAKSADKLKQLHSAFADPAWALSLGGSDDIACLEKITDIQPMEEVVAQGKDLTFCLIPGNYAESFSFDWETISNIPTSTTLELPVVKHLPIGFNFGSGGERKGARYLSFTFLKEIQQLTKPCTAYRLEDEIVPLVSIV
ncbi:MAG: CRISPR-associated protein Cas5 [Bacillota bacterium]